MNKKMIGTVILSTLALLGGTTYAGTITRVYLNGNKLLIKESPIVKNNTTYVPLRTLENMGAKMGWEQSTKTATIKLGFNTIEQRIGSDTAIVNSKAVKLPGSAFLENGTTYVPIRFISEAAGAEIDFDPKENSLYIDYEMPLGGQQQYDNFGRIMRKESLPKNANQYLYIAQGVPNEMYELPLLYHQYIQHNGNAFAEGKNYTRPINMKNQTQYFRDETVKQWRGQFEEYLNLVLNFDYRNVASDYAKNVASCYSKNYIEENTKAVKEFVQYAKERHLIIEGDYYVEPSITYITNAGFYQRAWVKFIIKSDKVSKGRMMQDIDDELKTNVWYEGYIDISLGTNNGGSDGTDMTIAPSNITTSTMIKELK